MPQQLHQLSSFHIGTAVKWPELSQKSSYSHLALSQFSSFTPENLLKASRIQPQRGKFNWQEADAFVKFTEQHGKRMHGHTLLWDRDLPPWINDVPGDEKVLLDHVRHIMTRYAGKFSGWDVVNEAFTETGELRPGSWFKVGGSEYLTKAFVAAEKADPHALLFYNDFDLEVNERKRDAVLSHLIKLRETGVRVDGIGVQLHLNLSTTRLNKIASSLKTMATENFLVHISELDVSVNPYDGETNTKEELFAMQAELLVQLFSLYSEINPSKRYGITFWGVCDNHSWITSDLKQVDYPLLFDDEYRAKPAWHALMKFFSNS